ncbi:MAG: hypothetical protein CBE11_02295 [Rickettsiales bacterium TMED251]|nr:MAG: hypothetical protein CBE11_02295 [Rickettsiales bacterium TMED251]
MFLNLINDKCPITFVKIKLALEKLKEKDVLTIHLSDKEAVEGLPESLNELGYKVLVKSKLENGIFSFKIAIKN